MVVGGQRHAPAALPPRKTRYPLYSRLGWAPGPVWTDAENLAPPPTGIRSPDCPPRSESLYRLSYPGPQILYMYIKHVHIHIHTASQKHRTKGYELTYFGWWKFRKEYSCGSFSGSAKCSGTLGCGAMSLALGS